MNDVLTIAACGVTGGAVGYTVSLLRPSGRRRGPHHRLLWQKAPPGSEDATIKTPMPGLESDPDAPTVQTPLLDGGALVSEGETAC